MKTKPINVSQIEYNVKQIRSILTNSLSEKINELPDNLKIKRLEKSGAFTMKISDLNNSVLSAGYYDFKIQYREILKIILTTPTEKMKNVLDQMMDKAIAGKTKLHPSVVMSVRDIYN
jgi:hypothetical protein